MKRTRTFAWMMLCGLALFQRISAEAAEPARQPHGKTVAQIEQELKQHPENPALQYNHGTLLYHERRYEQAAESLRKALSTSRASLQGRASYNLGNTYYQLGQAKEKTGSGEALALYRQALDGYRLAIRQDPHDRDAQYNYELVQKRLKALEAQQAKVEEAKAQQASAEQKPGSEAAQETQQQDAQQNAQAAKPSQEEQAASEASGQKQEEQLQAQQQEAGQQATEQSGEPREALKPDSSASEEKAAFDEKELSKQQALWILDSVKHEEQGALKKDGHAQEVPVERNW